MGMYVKLEGYDAAMRGLERFPSKVLKATTDSMRMAGRKAATELRRTAPGKFRRLVKSKVMKGQLTRNAYATFGYFKGKVVGDGIPDWFKAYWKNYGTLTHRDPNHHFREPVKPGGTSAAKGRKNNVGQAHENFYEAALPEAARVFQKTFEEQMTKKSNDLLKP